MRTHWRFAAAADILFGRGTAQQLGRELNLLKFKTAFVVTDANLVKAGVADTILSSLREAGLAAEVFDGCRPEPSTDVVMSAVAAVRQSKMPNPDCVIGLGGGSNMDTAKAASVVLAHGGEAWDYLGDDKIPGPVVPIVAIPTTAGTGSETTPIAVIEDTRKHLKLSMLSAHIFARLAVVDPLLTVSCPPRVTAESGMDALTHAIESYTIIEHHALAVPAEMRTGFGGRNVVSETLAARAIQLIAANLRTACYQPHHVPAREAMCEGALMAALSFANSGLSSVHAMQYPVGAVTHTSHGMGNAILLPATIEYLAPIESARLAECARWLGVNTSAMSDREAALACAEAVRQLNADIGIPPGLRAIGIEDKHIPDMAQTATTYARLNRCSPRALNAAAYEWMFHRAM